MIASLLCLALASGSPVVGFPRTEAPWTVLVVAADAAELDGLDRVLLAALFETPESWPADHPMQRVWHRGGSIDARATPDGIVIRFEGHTDDARLLLTASEELLRMPRPTPLSVARAQGRILRTRVQQADVGDLSATRLSWWTWSQWFGERAPTASLVVDDIALHRRSAGELWAVYAGWAKTAPLARFAEGRLPDAWKNDPPPPPAAAALRASPNKALVHVQAAVTRPRLVASHPLPPGELTEAMSVSLEAALTAEEPPIAVAVVGSRTGALLVLDTPLADRPPEKVLEALRAHLLAARVQLAARRAAAPLRRRAGAVAAQRHRLIGERAEQAALRWLGGVTPVSGADPLLPTDVRSLIFPEALRATVVQPLPRP